MNTFQIPTSIFMLVSSIIGVICSFTFIFIVAIDRRCRTPVILITVNSIVGGLITNIIYAFQAAYQMLGDTPDILCALRGCLLHCSTGLFYHTLCIQALYRLFVTVYAHQRSLQSTYVIVPIIIIQWLISITFAIPILLIGRILYQPDGRICQVAIDDIFGFMYLATFIYYLPIIIIIVIYILIIKYMKRNVVIAGVRQHAVEQRRQGRDIRFIQRILILVAVFFLTSFPYISFFLNSNINHIPMPSYGHRISFMCLSFGQGLVMLITLIFTDDVKRSLLNILADKLPFTRNRQIQNITTVGIPLQTHRTMTNTLL